MAQEFTIKSENIEDKINQLLPSQGGFGAGVDISASTMVVPIIDLTETAEGSGLRQDLQKSLSLTSVTAFSVSNANTTLINTTGYFRIFGNLSFENRSTVDAFANFQLTDGITTKVIYESRLPSDATKLSVTNNFDFIVFLKAGESLSAQSGHTTCFIVGSTRQIADINGNLINPS